MTEDSAPTPDSTPTPVPTPSPAPADTAPELGAPVPSPPPIQTRKRGSVNNPYIWGLGRRKAAVARVRIKSGEGKFIINKKEVDDYFRVETHRLTVHAPLRATDTGKSFDVFVNVCGGGITGQAGAISLGLSRALAQVDPDHETKLRDKRLMSRDPRRVERKKYGQPGARKRFQFSKR